MRCGSHKKDVPMTTAVVTFPSKRIDNLKLLIPAYAIPGQLPDAVADLLWQIHKAIADKHSPIGEK